MTKLRLLILFSLAILGNVFAQTIGVTLSEHIPGVDYKKNPALNFKRNGVLLHSILPIAEGQSLAEKAMGSQKTPVDVILANAWLIKTGQFDKFRQLLGSSLTDDQRESVSDEIMKKMQGFYEKLDTIAPIVELRDKDNSGVWVIYKASGKENQVVYIDFAKKVGDVYVPVFGDLEHDAEISNIMNALVTENLKHTSGLVTLKQAN